MNRLSISLLILACVLWLSQSSAQNPVAYFGPPCTKVINISQTTTTDVHTSVGFTHVCGGVLVASAAMNIGVDEGTGTTCETSGTALIGTSSTSSATPSTAIAANGGFLLQPFQTQTANDHLCVLQGTGTVAGYISYVDLPY